MLALATELAEPARAPIDHELDQPAIRRAAQGDPVASRQLVERYQHRVFALISRMLWRQGRATIEDIAQDTFLRVFQSLGRFDLDGPAKLSTWILTIAARRSIDELRRMRPVPTDDIRGTSADRTDADVERKQLIAAIEAALAELSPELRAAFLLREYHGLEYTEIARSLGIELGTVKSRLARARTLLRERLAEVAR
ncbi:MAG: sigma-70 family RNA polymerase sigma factor [Kofleriaceae bacterium]